MSVASRARDALRRRQAYCDRYLGGFPTWPEFRAWQLTQLPRYLDTPEALARRAKIEVEWARGRVLVAPGSDTFVEGIAIPDPLVLDSDPQPI